MKTRKKRWGPADDARMKAMLAEGKTRDEIAAVMGCNVSTVYAALRRLKIRKDRGSRGPRVLEMAAAGVEPDEIARELGMSRWGVDKHIAKSQARSLGLATGWRLNEAERAEIGRMLADGVPVNRISLLTGRDYWTIRKVRDSKGG